MALLYVCVVIVLEIPSSTATDAVFSMYVRDIDERRPRESRRGWVGYEACTLTRQQEVFRVEETVERNSREANWEI